MKSQPVAVNYSEAVSLQIIETMLGEIGDSLVFNEQIKTISDFEPDSTVISEICKAVAEILCKRMNQPATSGTSA